MEKPTENKKRWKLKSKLDGLTARERIDALMLLYFLNEYKHEDIAFEMIKSKWIDELYGLPKTSHRRYNSIKNVRYTILKRIKKIFNNYLILQ